MIFLKENGAKIKEDFNALRKKYPSLLREAEEQLGTLEPDTALALQFLYIAMPLSDMANYRFDLFLEYALHGVWLWEHSEAVRELPEGIYLEYVLLHRVNGEEIRPCRRQFAAELWDRVAEKNAHDAAIETNFWCAEHVTYQSTDDRTLSAAATYERGYGRCGEESVFCVNALRSVGIPARQVYAPKWGHCDDNHAWVEVWCEGEWYYLGACEPEMRLNRGWFREASSRAMMVHSRSFWLPADNTVMNMEGIVSMRNQLPRYASAQEICVLALESDGTPAAGVTVTFGLLNYAEYAPVATVRTGEDGRAQFWTGFGSLYVQVAASDGRYKGSLMDTRSVTMISVKLPEKTALQPPDEWEDIDFFAPLEMPPQALSAELTLRERNMGRERLNQANQLRTSRTESWENSERVFFLSKERDQKWREKLLSVLTEKDQTDLKADILEEHLNYALPYADVTEEDLFVHYILNPRVSDEILACWRKEILAFFDDKKDCFQHDPVRIWRWITEHIESRPEREHNQVITLPAACLKGGIGSTASKKILFVAIARTFGVPARLNPCDAEPEYWDGERFVTVSE
ncbi:MAG: transglutaminase, partial [Lachnospiraceae bacterium]|nr:transglutaminase [Lachnospiraceae bacterium]